jgi:hypothetical protein
MTALWRVATAEERHDMVMLILEPGGLHYDVEMKEIAAITPRPVFLPVLRLLEGVVEYEEATGTLVTRRWQQRNRRASDYPQEYRVTARQAGIAVYPLPYYSTHGRIFGRFYRLRTLVLVSNTGCGRRGLPLFADVLCALKSFSLVRSMSRFFARNRRRCYKRCYM